MSRKRVRESELKAVKREHVFHDFNLKTHFPPIDADPKVLRSRYLAIKTRINDEKDNLSNQSSDKFNSILSEVENLHLLVQKPREQVVDAEALLGIANSLAASVKSHTLGDGLTPFDFVTCLLRRFGQHKNNNAGTTTDSIVWNDVGFAASPIIQMFYGCSTMLRPMDNELKMRVMKNATTSRRHAPLTKSEQPEQVGDPKNERTDTDKNMVTMFDILKNKKIVKLENLLLNRKSFAQTVENLFVLSFLVKEGKVEISLDMNGCHFVSPRNAPSAASVSSGNTVISHFTFRFDFNDWKLMMNLVPVGLEIMPHRRESRIAVDNVAENKPRVDSEGPLKVPPSIKRVSRNYDTTKEVSRSSLKIHSDQKPECCI